MDATAIGTELAVLAEAEDRVVARRKALEVRALALIDRGETVANYHLDWAQPRTVFDKTKIAEVAPLINMFSEGLVQLGIPLPTPRQCVKAGVDEAVIKPYTTQAPASKKLVRTDPNHAAKLFGTRITRGR
jgi:hypothetical protein